MTEMTREDFIMSLKKTIVATLIASGMLAALAGPIPAGAEAVQEKRQEDRWTVQVDPKFTEKLNKAVKLFAGKDVELQKAGKLGIYSPYVAEVRSVDGKYFAQYDIDTGTIWTVGGQTATLEQISKQDQEEVLKALKGLYAKKDYVFDNEVKVTHQYTDEKAEVRDEITYTLRGKDFSASLNKNWVIGGDSLSYITIDFDKNELDPKLFKAATDAAKTAFNHKFEMKQGQLEAFFSPHVSKKGQKPELKWVLRDDKVRISADPKSGKINSVINELGIKVRDNKGISEKEAKEAVAPLAKKLFNIDLNGYNVKWDNLEKNYYFTKKSGTSVRAALDSNKKVVYIKAGSAAAPGA
ncbi:MAG: hypothetical protein E6230_22630 [Paenibacillus dendritiformis]|uniref:hypothetical protein n=1 Tax=uncultured Paenibacillus sp. TaxID=227322 RepID=UPI002805395A|nr:hypothetical protein [uncultured Paenibacillus sp.]MDU5144972.1 hypothetical protein [Paenibacillus dendritiformis]